MNRSADGASCPGIQRNRLLTCDQVLDHWDSDEELNTQNDSDYDENDLVSDADDMLSSDEEEDPVQPSGDAQPATGAVPRPRQRGANRVPSKFETGWSDTFDNARPTTVHDFNPPGPFGPQNMPAHINAESTEADFLNLFLDDEFWDNLTNQTNNRAQQKKRDKPNYYTKNFSDVEVRDMKAFLGLRLTMEYSGIVKPRFEDYFRENNFLLNMPGFRDVMPRDQFMAIWGFLHIVDEEDRTIDKEDKIYKVRPMLNHILPRFRYFYTPKQHLGLDEGMIPEKNCLGI